MALTILQLTLRHSQDIIIWKQKTTTSRIFSCHMVYLDRPIMKFIDHQLVKISIKTISVLYDAVFRNKHVTNRKIRKLSYTNNVWMKDKNNTKL